MNKQKSLFIVILLCFNLSFSQVFTAENGNFIDLNNHEIKLSIEGTAYTGTFQNFTSKKDKKEFLIFSYFSRSILILLDKPLNTFEKSIPILNIKMVKLVHSNMIASIIKTVNKKGINNLENFIMVYESSEETFIQLHNNLSYSMPL